ncbi:hypothetical protein [Sphingomonas sp.]
MRFAKWMLMLLLPAIVLGAPIGLWLGGYAAGEAMPTLMAGNRLPDYGAETASADAADALRPADIAYIPEDRYAAAAQRWGN